MSWAALLLTTLVAPGQYVQDCRWGFERAETFSGAEVVYRERNFADVSCELPQVTSRSYGVYTLGAEVAEPTGAREIDFTFTRVTIAPESEAVAASYRMRKMCGLEGWQVGEETEVTGHLCDLLGNGSLVLLPTAGDMRFGVIKIEESALYFGALSPEKNALTPERRPLVLDPLPYRRRAE